MTKLEYWKSVQDGDFIQACKDAGIKLVSTNASDARAEFIQKDLESELKMDYFRSKELMLDLFLVGLKFRDLTSYEYGMLFTLEARLDEESVQDRLSCEIDFEETIKTSGYIIKSCKSILNNLPSSKAKELLESYMSRYSFDKNKVLDWWSLVYELISGGRQSLECDAYILGRMHDIIKSENLGDTYIVTVLGMLLSSINYRSVEEDELYYGYNLLRSYFQGEDSSFSDLMYINDELRFMNELDKDVSESLSNNIKCSNIDKLIATFYDE